MKKLIILLAGFLLLFVANVQCQLSTSLEEYYKLDETYGQALNSVSGSNNSTSMTASQGSAGKLGNAYSFDGVSQLITFGSSSNWSITSSSNLSISVWIYLTGDIVANGYGSIWGHQDGPQFFLRKVSAGNYVIGWYAGNSPASTNELSFTFNTWYHLVMTKSGSSLNFYRNGSNVGSATATDNNVNPSNVYIGGDMHTSFEAFKGRIDELGIWKKVLSPGDVTQLYAGGNGLPYSSFGTTVPVTGVTVAPTSASVAIGGTTQLTKTIAPANATNQAVTWTSNNPPVATVNSIGLVTGVAAGSATITVITTDGGRTASSTITVTSATIAVTGVTVAPTSTSILAGSTAQLTATVAPANATNKNVSWSSSNTSFATVNSSGLVTGVAAGPATITVTTADGSKTATSGVTVTGGGTASWVSNGSNLTTTGNVGIGITTPNEKLDINGSILLRNSSNVSDAGAYIHLSSYNGIDYPGPKIRSSLVYAASGTVSKSKLILSSYWEGYKDEMTLMNGNVGIGTYNPSSKLTVNGKILATEVEVISSIAADYVFEPDYHLMPLDQLDLYLKENKHLPGIPSAVEFSKQGQNLGKTDDMLLRKIEELTLYIIDQEKSIQELKCEIENLKTSLINK